MIHKIIPNNQNIKEVTKVFEHKNVTIKLWVPVLFTVQCPLPHCIKTAYRVAALLKNKRK